jgi:hypothetical protein
MARERSLARVVQLVYLLCSAQLAGACKSEPKTDVPATVAAPISVAPTGTPAPSAAALSPSSPAPSPAPGSHSAQPLRADIEEKLYAGKCPSWVRGARTKVDDTRDGVRVVVTAESEPAVAEIRSRARYLAQGKSAGGDATGRCPVPRDARIEATDIEHGAEFKVRPAPNGSLKDLRTRVHAMTALLPKP